MPRPATKTRTAIMTNPWSGYRSEERVRITKSKARAAGADGVTFWAPGWRSMAFRSMDAAVRKIEAHPGFIAWEA